MNPLMVDQIIEQIVGFPAHRLHEDDLEWWREVITKAVAHLDAHPPACRWSEPRTVVTESHLSS